MARVVWVLDEIGCLLEATFLVDPIDGVDRAMSTTFFSLLCFWPFEFLNQAMLQLISMLSTVHMYKFNRVFEDIPNLQT